MKIFTIGTGLVVVGGLLVIVLYPLGVPHLVAVIISLVVATIGFIIQMHSAFSMRFSFKKEMRIKKQEHEEIMRKSAQLPPEQAIKLLLDSMQ